MENNPVTVINTMPKFMSFDQDTLVYNIAPTNPNSDLGIFIIKVILSDTNMMIQEMFQV
jgi:hypothetical protein